MKKVKIYSQPTCADCNRAKDYFKAKGIPFEDINILKNRPAHEEMVKVYGIDVTPVIIVDDQVMIGFNPPKLNKLLSSH